MLTSEAEAIAGVVLALTERLQRSINDPEYQRLAPGLHATIAFDVDGVQVGLVVTDGVVALTAPADTAPTDASIAERIVVRAAAMAWQSVLKCPPPPTFSSFTALQRANPAFEVVGDALHISRSRAFLERLFERMIDVSPSLVKPVARDASLAVGSYRDIVIDGDVHQVFMERSGTGTPILFLHTAGADARQFLAQVTDQELARRWSMWAVDMPFHGRSMPPRSWDGGDYRLTAARYLAWCVAIIEQLIDEPAIIVGGSMGAALALVLAAERPDLVRSVVAIEPPFQSRGRLDPSQHHVGVHGGLHNAAFVRGLMSPESPEVERRRTAWIYSQGAPGIYRGDLAFYSDEFDGAEVGPRIDCRRTPVTLLSGTYDYSATPADGLKLAATMPGARFVAMNALGHFPMCENPDLFRPWLLDALLSSDTEQPVEEIKCHSPSESAS